MLTVVSLEEARALVARRFAHLAAPAGGKRPVGLVATCDVVAKEGVPPFDRSTVDGYAVVAADTFGSSDALPALLQLAGEVDMGEAPRCACAPGTCVRIPTGGQVPEGANAVAMLEHCEEFGDGTVGVARAVAPGENIVYRNDDVKPGQVLIPAGALLQPHHLGTLASLGLSPQDVCKEAGEGGPAAVAEPVAANVAVAEPVSEAAPATEPEPLRVGVISTGDEIVEATQTPVAAQMRDVNGPLLAAAVQGCGARAVRFPIVPDRYEELLATVGEALETCDMVLVSGGSSAGRKDNTARVLDQVGELLFHGIAVKPGKPTLCADAAGTPLFGLPGHPVAAYYLFRELVRPLLLGRFAAAGAGACTAAAPDLQVEAVLAAGIPSNHGRAEFVAVRLEHADTDDGAAPPRAVPVRGKSGLISQLCGTDGYITVPRDCEGLAAGAPVAVALW